MSAEERVEAMRAALEYATGKKIKIVEVQARAGPEQRSGPDRGDGAAQHNQYADHGDEVQGYRTTPEDFLAAALEYAERGWPVFPLTPGDKRPLPGSHGFKDATIVFMTIERWWAKTPDANIGIPTGARSGLIVLDEDGPKGEATLAKLERELGPLPDTRTVRTPRGRHRYFQHPGGTVQNSAGRLGPGLDVRGDGGYVVAPPSVRPDGRYATEQDQDVRPLPPAWLNLLRDGTKEPDPQQKPDPEQAPAEDNPFDPPGRTYTRAAAEASIEEHALAPLRAAVEGSRNTQLFESRLYADHFVPAFWSHEQADDALTAIGLELGLEPGEIKATINSARGRADWKAKLVEDQAEEPEPRTSRRVDLGPFLDGTWTPPEATVGAARSDGVCLLYPAKWHTMISLTGAGKSWWAIWHAAAVLEAGGIVVYLHFEEATPASTLARFRTLGVPVDVLRERLVWLDCSTRLTREEYEAELTALDPAPKLVILDGINAACSLHGHAPDKTETVGAYRHTYVAPATRLDAAVLSLGHPPKARDRQTERHGYGSTAWLDEVDGVGFRLESTRTPIHRGARGGSRLYSVKDRHGGVERHGVLNDGREAGWYFLGTFTLDDTRTPLIVDGEQITAGTTAELLAPVAEQDRVETADPIDKLGDEIVAYLAEHGRRYPSVRVLRDGLRAASVKLKDGDLGPALERLEMTGRLEQAPYQDRKPRPGWLPGSQPDSTTAGSQGNEGE